jgi:nucleotide-binding universal stress UspA family protein
MAAESQNSTIRSILAAVDLGETTTTVLRSAQTLARAAQASLHVTHAIELDQQHPHSAAAGFQPLIAHVERTLARAVARELTKVEPASVETLLYARHRTIANRAREVNADLIVLGPHRHGRAALGTTVDRVLRTADCPCWITQRPVHLPLTKIVLATDLSDAAANALAAMGTIARLYGQGRLEIVLLHVLHPAVSLDDVEVMRRTLEKHAEGWVAAQGLSASIRMRIAVRRSRNTADAILTYLRRQHPSLLIMGTHGHGMLDRLLLGSVTTRVLREVPCDALAVPPH